jgi:hypothetical protein
MKINLEPEHFSSRLKTIRNSNYTIEVFLNECIDNVIKKAKQININISNTDDNEIEEISISDN